ncbi:MAG: ATP-dependent RNA helicase HrpA [Gammaproteobacteria bacterium]
MTASPPNSKDALDAIELDTLMLRDRHAFARLKSQSLNASRAQAAVKRFETSARRAATRAAMTLDTSIPEDLPLALKAAEISAALAAHQVVVVCGATGSGKTTQLPKLCLAAGRGVFGTIGHTQPRRLAARAVADRVAEELGTTLGEGVGFRVRFADQTGPNCRVKLMTDGMLLQELKSDPWLNEYDTLILDEAHERSLNIDFLLGVIKKRLAQRPDLKLIVTSATIDPDRFSRYFDDAPVVEVSGRGYPIEMRYRDDDAPLPQRVCSAVQSLTSESADGDMLVFLPGERDIRDCEKALRGAGLARRLEVLPLYARLSAARQAKVFKPGKQRRVVLTTNVAETSLTVPRIRYVIDSGLARIGRYSHRSKMQRLPIEPVAVANLDQRAGRCGRLGPGVCVRLFDQDSLDERAPFEAPEIQRSNLAGVILQMASLRLGQIEHFDFMDPPDDRLVKDGYSVLRELGALDEYDDITQIGRGMAGLPLSPRLSRALLGAQKFGCVDEALIVVSALAVPDPVERRDGPDLDFVDKRSDWVTRLNLWRAMHETGSVSAQRRWCKDAGVSWPRVMEWKDVQRQLRSTCRERRLTVNDKPADSSALHRALLTGFVSHIGEKVDARRYRGARGREFAIFPGSGVAKSAPPWIVATELIETSRVFGHGIAAVTPGWIVEAADHLIRREAFDPQWSAAKGRATARQRAVVFGLSIELRQRVPLAALDPAGARSLLITHALVAPVSKGKVGQLAFMQANRRKLQDAQRFESRCRRLVIDEAALFRFFDRQLPATVVDERALLHWHQSLKPPVQKALAFDWSDLGLEHAPDLAWYPNTFALGRNELPLRYVFAPGSDNDGVTLQLPTALLGQVDVGALQWLVPGWLDEKVERLLRALPKSQRKRLAPIGEAARAFVAQTLGESPHIPEVSLWRALARFATERCGEPVAPPAFAAATLEPYLHARIEVLDEHGKVVDEARDLASLSTQHARAERPLNTKTNWHRDGIEHWDFGDLPDSVVIKQGGVELDGRPALVAQGAQVNLRVFADADEAALQHARGVAHWVLNVLKDKQRYLQKNLPKANALALLYAPLGDTQALFADIALCAIEELAPVPLHTVRTAEAFETLVTAARGNIISSAQSLAALMHDVLSRRQQTLALLDKPPVMSHPQIAQDLREQIEALVPADFLSATPAQWRTHVPRFFDAAKRRIEKLGQQGRENPALQQDVQSRMARYQKMDDPAQRARLTEFRFLLEEYRVSLFSQPMKTSRPVSAKRLDAAWKKALRD